MRKSFLLVALSSLILAGCQPADQPSPVDEPPPVSQAPFISEAQARQVAESECIGEGESVSRGYFNEYSRTWWFDATLKDAKEGCHPACVVREDGSWEINWRCTGLIPEENNVE